MLVNLQVIGDRIAALKAGQHDPAFRPARLTKKGEELRAERKEARRLAKNEYNRKRREANGCVPRPKKSDEERRQARNEYQRKKREAAGILPKPKKQPKLPVPGPEREIARRVREIAKARKIYPDLKDAPLPVNEGHIKLRKTVGEKKFEPRVGPPDLTGSTPVQVDSKTWIYVRAGKDIQEAVDRYRNRHNLPAKDFGRPADSDEA